MKKIMKIFWVVTLLTTLQLFAGHLKVQVTSTRVPQGQSVGVKLIAEGSKVKFPAIQEIDGIPVEHLRRASKLETRYVNGKFSSKNQKILSFEFYPTKTVTLPAFSVRIDGKTYQSKPVKIEVVKGTAAGGGPVGNFALQMHADKKEIYLGEPLILTVDAVEPINGSIVQMQYAPPQFKDFFVKPLGGENQIRRGNSTVHELKYLLIPNKVGRIVIPPAQVRIGLKDLQAVSDPFGIFGTPVKWYSIRSNPLTLNVKPLPVKADLIGNFTIRAKVDKRKVQANKPVNYTLEISGEGSLEDLADPVFDIPGVTVYSDDAKVESRFENGRLKSTYRKDYAFISDRDFTIPALALTVFDPRSGKVKEIMTKVISIKVTGGGAASAPRSGSVSSQPGRQAAASNRAGTASPGVSSRAQTPKKRENLLTDEAYYAKKAYEEKAAKLPWYLAAAFAGGMAVMLLAVLFYRKVRSGRKSVRGRVRHYSLDEALKILYPHTNDDPEVEAMVRRLYGVKNGEKVEIDRKALDRLAAKYDSVTRQ